MHPPEFFFNKIVHTFWISSSTGRKPIITIEYSSGDIDRVSIPFDLYNELTREPDTNQHVSLDMLFSKYFPRYKQIRNQLVDQTHDGQIPLVNLSNELIELRRELRETIGILYGSQLPLTYDGCNECYNYSMVFGGDVYAKTHKKIKTEEDFEIVKSDFVEHFNKEHPDLVAKKRAVKPVKKKFKKMKDKIFTMSASFNDEFFENLNMVFNSGNNCTLNIQSVEEPSREWSTVIQRAEERRGGFRSRRTNRHEVQ